MTRITENQWVDYFGFQRFPFDRPEAGNEEFSRPEFLAACFVKPDKFDKIMGQADNPVSSFLFAARGTGKTACRVMIDYYCKIGNFPLKSHKDTQNNFVLSIPHVYLSNVVDMSRREDGKIHILAKNHVAEILQRAIPVFVELIAKMPDGIANVQKLLDADKKDLGWLIACYSNHLSSAQANFVQSIGLNVFAQGESSIGFPHLSKSNKTPRQSSLAGYRLSKQAQNSPLDHLRDWTYLVHKVGISSTYVLIDGVDEIMETADADNPEFGYEIIRPLLTNLQLMDSTPYLALKFFLPSQLEPFLNADKAFRRDRGFVIETIAWTEDELIKLLRNRIDALKHPDFEIRDRTVAGFDTLCIPELREQIEYDLAGQAKGNPRHLMNLCAQMVVAHCGREIEDQDDPYQLNREDLFLAQSKFGQEMNQAIRVFEKDQPDVMALIAQGESETLEFKSSIRYDYKRQSVNKDELGLVIAKTIAGLLNRSGGVLIIGVNDEGQILGIEKDFESLAKRNVDGFQLALKDIVKTYLGMEYVANLQLYFETIAERTVCAIIVQKGSTPVYVKIGDSSEFFVRMLNSTVKLGLPEAVSYIHSHWS